ncbi:MAG: ATP-binding domain-containing protein, partial [Elusimicrobia bacterium]|nr:ATP-binding domain-containing protein [Elusimicrobiota bacterium]
PARGIGKTAQEKLADYCALKGISLYEAAVSHHHIEGLTPSARRGLAEFLTIIEKLRANIKEEPPSMTLQKMFELSGYWKSIEADLEKDAREAGSKLDNLRELVNVAKEYEEKCQRAGTQLTLSGYLEEISLVSDVDQLDSGNCAVTLMTVHLAKGLEFPAVFVTGLEEGLFPIGATEAPEEELEEERRLCYVGMTRARERLFLSYAATRRLFGKVYSNWPSRFLHESGLMKETWRPIAREKVELAPAPKPAIFGRRLTGQSVRHAVYGVGKIIAQSGSGEKTKVTVAFEQMGDVHTFMLRYAPFEIL